MIVPAQLAVFPLQPRWGLRPTRCARRSPRPVFGIVQRWVVEGKGVRSGERVGEGATAGRLEPARGMYTRAGTAGTDSLTDSTLSGGRAARRSTERQRSSRPS